MKSVLLIGLGRFGRHVAIKLTELGHEVMAIDKDQGRVEAALPIVTNALIGDSTRQDFMASLGVRDFDLCIVGIGDDFQSSLETTSLLKELGANKIFLFVTHCEKTVFEGELFKSGLIDKLFTTDSIFTPSVQEMAKSKGVADKIEVIPLI